MMGKHQAQKDLFSYSVDLDKRVRQNHPLRKVAERIDFGFVRKEVKTKYGKNGNEWIDPEIILKLMFLLFWDDIRSERELMQILPERLDYLWFLGYGLDDDIPNHSVLSKARARWGSEVFENLFIRRVSQCVEAGLVEGSKIHMDGSLVDANASKDSVVKASAELIDQLREAYGAVEAKLDGHLGDPYYQPVNRTLLSTTDPDAPCVSHKKSAGGGDSRPRYKNHRAIDDRHGVITATITTPGNIDEGSQAETLINGHEKNCGKTVEAAIADSQYGTVEVMRSLQARGIRTHMKTHAGNARKNPSIFALSDFVYKPEEDVFTCPAGETLYPKHYNTRRKATEYKTLANVCSQCQLRESCTKSKTGRTLKRHLAQELIDEAVEQSRSKEAWLDRIRRRTLMEGSFAQCANLHHFKRSRWRRLDKQRIQDHIICAVQNTKLLITRCLPPKTTAEALERLNSKIQYLNTLLKSLYKELIAKVKPRKGRNGLLTTFFVNNHNILNRLIRHPLGNSPLIPDRTPTSAAAPLYPGVCRKK
jgi:transposase